MKEEEYIIAANRVKISAALTIIRDVLPGDNYGISDKDTEDLIVKLRKHEIELYNSYTVIVKLRKHER